MTPRVLVDEWGEKRAGNRVTLYHEGARERFLVERYIAGRPRRRVFSYKGGSKPAARREAAAYAAELSTAISARGANAADRAIATTSALYDRYTTAVGGSWRPATHLSQRHRWRHWEAFYKPGTPPDHVDEDVLDDFLKALRKSGISPNQIRQTFACLRAVYRMGLRRGWVKATAPVTYELRLGKDERAAEPEEYSPVEFWRIVQAMDPHSDADWRCLVAFLLAGSQGARINSIRHLRWEDVNLESGEITWPAEWMKQGKTFAQPLTDSGREAIKLACHWREQLGITTQWVIPARRDPTRAASHASLDSRLHEMEDRAGVEHLPLRGFHGARRLAATNVYERTGDILAAGEWIGDKDTKQVMKYLKRKSERLTQAAGAASQATEGAFRLTVATVPTTVPGGRRTTRNPA